MLGPGGGREWVQAEQSAAVAVAASAASADLVATLLETSGIRAWHEAYSGVYPSIDWVEGHRVRVEAADRDRALTLLRAMDLGAGAAALPDEPT